MPFGKVIVGNGGVILLAQLSFIFFWLDVEDPLILLVLKAKWEVVSGIKN